MAHFLGVYIHCSNWHAHEAGGFVNEPANDFYLDYRYIIYMIGPY